MSRIRVSLVFGTRPEAIKMAPIWRELSRRAQQFETSVIVTAQHRQMLDQMLAVFAMEPKYDLDVMQEGQNPTQIASRVLAGLQPILKQESPDIVLVQGDTTTVFAASLAAFHEHILVGHVEAGLRTGNKLSPFPEEMNRRLTSQIADVHFAATKPAWQNLLNAGISPDSIFVSGNPVVDALRGIMETAPPLAATEFGWVDELDGRVILVTAHRRENLGVPLVKICEALRQIVEQHGDVTVIYPMHPNPSVRQAVNETLGGHDRVVLCEPPDYLTFVPLMARADLIITDSGGIQEEAPALGVPVLVARDTTERSEGVDAGVAKLVGTETETIFEAAHDLLTSPSAYQAMTSGGCPYGDGHAAERICDALAYVFGLQAERPADWWWEAKVRGEMGVRGASG